MRLKLTSLIVLFCVTLVWNLKGQSGFIVDHNHTDIHEIPDAWIDRGGGFLRTAGFRHRYRAGNLVSVPC